LAESFNRMTAQLRETMAELAALNRDLESEVERRTDEIRRQAEFTEVLNAPISPGVSDDLSKLAMTAVSSLVSATGVRAAALWLVRDDRVDFDLQLAARHGEDPALGEVPADEAICRSGRPG